MNVTRRSFIKHGAQAASALAAMDVFEQLAVAANANSNPFAYDVSKLAKTDPKLIAYEEANRIRCPRKGAKRITIGGDDRIYLAVGNGVCVLDRDGAAINEIALKGQAQCSAIARDGTIYVSAGGHIEVFDAKGKQLASWESPGKRTYISSLAAAENDVFAADSGNRIVYRYDRSGKLVGRIGEKNKERHVPGFVLPSPYLDVDIHRDGLLRVNNPGRHNVHAFTFDGDIEQTWGEPGMGIKGFCGCCNPIGIALLPDGRTVTCEKGLPRVKIYGVDGKFESVVAGAESFAENLKACEGGDALKGALDAAVDSKGRILILDPVTDDIRVMTAKVNAAKAS